MKTIGQFVAGGITTLADLQNALQTAMQLEFATIPPYLWVSRLIRFAATRTRFA